MIGSNRRARSNINVWPGYVDALSALLMLVIFMLLIYIVSQLYLSQTLSDRNTQLANLQDRLAEISRQLGLEQDRSEDLESRLDIQTQLSLLAQEKVEDQELLIEDLSGALSQRERELEVKQDELADKEELSASQQDWIMHLSNQIATLQNQLERINAALNLQEELTAAKDEELEKMAQRINMLMAQRINRLERYQSEFFARLREALEGNENVRIVGDRFLLPSELLFGSGSARLGADGQAELDKLAQVLLDVVERIPEDIDWILRVDGHTDRVPINTPLFPSNWELSTARAVAVVRYLASKGVPERRMVAAGFGEFAPVDKGTSEAALQRNRRIEIKLTDR